MMCASRLLTITPYEGAIFDTFFLFQFFIRWARILFVFLKFFFCQIEEQEGFPLRYSRHVKASNIFFLYPTILSGLISSYCVFDVDSFSRFSSCLNLVSLGCPSFLFLLPSFLPLLLSFLPSFGILFFLRFSHSFYISFFLFIHQSFLFFFNFFLLFFSFLFFFYYPSTLPFFIFSFLSFFPFIFLFSLIVSVIIYLPFSFSFLL